MKKNHKVLLIITVAILITFNVFKTLGYVGYYRMPTSSMTPAIPVNSMVFSTKSFNYKRGDVIVFKVIKPDNPIRTKEGEIWLKRLIGLAGDSVELKNGYAYVNGDKVDIGYEVLFVYKLLNTNENNTAFEGLNIDQLEGLNAGYIFVSEEFAKKNKAELQLEPIDFPIKNEEYNFVSTYPADWSDKNWGPMIVPEGHVFVLGDNRSNSIDSRHIGFLPNEHIISKVVKSFIKKK